MERDKLVSSFSLHRTNDCGKLKTACDIYTEEQVPHNSLEGCRSYAGSHLVQDAGIQLKDYVFRLVIMFCKVALYLSGHLISPGHFLRLLPQFTVQSRLASTSTSCLHNMQVHCHRHLNQRQS